MANLCQSKIFCKTKKSEDSLKQTQTPKTSHFSFESQQSETC